MNISAVAAHTTPEPDVTAAVMIERARALRGTLRDEQAATEARGTYSPRTHDLFAKAGFYRMQQPRAYGGYEFDVASFLKVIVEIARGCPGTGWCLCLAAGHHIEMASFFSRAAQDAVYGSGHFAAPLRPIPMGTATPVADGWSVSGRWDYCSGAPYATHAMLGVRIGTDDPTAPVGTVVIPRDQWTLVDDWAASVLGMSGSGSNSISVEGAVIPDEFLVPGSIRDVPTGRDSPGYQLHGNPLYAGITDGYGVLEIGAILVGTARAAADEYERLLREKKTAGPNPRPRHTAEQYQRWFAEAIAKIDAAEDILLAGAAKFAECCRDCVENPDGDWPERLARLDLSTHFVIFELAWDAVELLFSTAGSSEGPRNGSRMQRYYRDFSMARTNVFPRATTASRVFASVYFGSDPV
ncbi:acyl-CoA dehydrogenase family protein [Nocardia miyunensis]|uniref:acyl-CoA dehydrogenase family protein n=1 Tax=Nocardia miyunensis TaxID=282684 RepID=UPI000832A069|nr:acyl-CoA dehydrogenase family protein [Nocardia miyunensis]